MDQIFITGATGNVGLEVIRALLPIQGSLSIVAGVRDPTKSAGLFPEAMGLRFRVFDFERPETWSLAFKGIRSVFLLRPPHLSNVAKIFHPLLDHLKSEGIENVMFLSVQGVEASRIIPHHKIEKAIIARGFRHVFLRPAYFMQNLSTTLCRDIREHSLISLPAGRAVFNWVDLADVGRVAAHLLIDFQSHIGEAHDLTGPENLSFSEVADMMSQSLKRKITFRSPNLFCFFAVQRRIGTPPGLILVLIFLHFLPRFQRPPVFSPAIERIAGQKAGKLTDFIEREKVVWMQ